jgi:AraC family transcriptional regulator
MPVDVVNQPSLRVASVRHIGPYSEIAEAFERLGEAAGKAGLFGSGALMLGLYHDDPRVTPEGELRSDAAITLRDGAKVPPGLTEQVVPGGRFARMTYNGPYDGLPDAWKELMGEWFPNSGESSGDGIAYELYRNDPTDTAPEDLVTEIYVPLV